MPEADIENLSMKSAIRNFGNEWAKQKSGMKSSNVEMVTSLARPKYQPNKLSSDTHKAREISGDQRTHGGEQ